MTTDPKSILFSWCKHAGVTPADLMRAIGCTYSHAWRIIHDPEYPINYPTLARLLIAFGSDGPALAIAQAIKEQRGTP